MSTFLSFVSFVSCVSFILYLSSLASSVAAVAAVAAVVAAAVLLSPFLPLPKPRGLAVSVKVSASTGSVGISFEAAAGFGAMLVSSMGLMASCVSGPSDTALACFTTVSSCVKLLVEPSAPTLSGGSLDMTPSVVSRMSEALREMLCKEKCCNSSKVPTTRDAP